MKRWGLLAICLLVVAACAPTLKMEQYGGAIQIEDDELPHHVAILPFANETTEPGIDQLVRRNFANHFTSKPYHDVKLPIVDEKVVQFEKSTGKKLAQATPQEVAGAVGSDGLIYGRVTDYKRIYAAVYSQFGVEAEVWMVNATTGKEVFRYKEKVRYHEGGVPTSPLSALVTAVSTAMNLREIQKVRMVNELCYKFMEKIPAPKSLAMESRPLIREVLTNAADGPFGLKKTIKIGMEGDAGLVATFDIGNFKKGVLMKEVKPGVYVGDYVVMPGDATQEMPVLVTLTRPGGYETQWQDTGYITIDTTPPPRVEVVRTRGFADRVQLSWVDLKNVSDLKGYRVWRSDQPLSGYQELAVTELPQYADTAVPAGVLRYYRISPFDRAGNEAEPSNVASGGIVASEPVPLAGEIKTDKTLNGVFLVNDTVTVPCGVTLTIGADSRLLFAEGKGLVVQGRLLAAGGETVVEFTRAGTAAWQGIVLEGAHAELTRVRIKGAVTGLKARDTDGFIDGAVIQENAAGIDIRGMTGLTVKNCAINANATGAALCGADARLTGNTIVQNGTGVTLDAFAGELRDNNIYDNEKNIVAAKPVKVGANYFGPVIIDEMRLSGVTPEKVYDGKLPGGKVVAAVANPYSGLSAAERQTKGTELLIEAGNYFRARNYGKAVTIFEEALKAAPSAEIYYYVSLCYQEMRENERALAFLEQAVGKFPQDPLLWKSLGLMHYEKGAEAEAKKALQEVLRLSPEDRQARFIMERLANAGVQK
jgi:hypothetical protein